MSSRSRRVWSRRRSMRAAHRGRLYRSLAHRALGYEPLENRALLAAFSDAGNNDTVASAQLLFNDTSYTVDGRLSTHPDRDFYKFYVEAGNTISATVRATFNGVPPSEDKQLDPMVGIFSPDGSLVQENDDGGWTEAVPWTALATYTATESGFWTVGVTDYSDYGFYGAVDEGPGLKVGKYQLTILGASKLEIKDSNVSAEYDVDGNGGTTFGTYISHASLQNQFTVALDFDVPDELAIEYQFDYFQTFPANRNGNQFTFTQDMGRVRPENPRMEIRLVHSATKSVLDTYSADILFVKDLDYTLKFDGVEAKDLRLIGSQINEGSWPVEASISNLSFCGSFCDQYTSQALFLRRKSLSASGISSVTLSGKGNGTFTGSYNVGSLLDVNSTGTDYEFALMGTLQTGNPAPFTKSTEILVISYPRWIDAFTVGTATYSGGNYQIDLNTSNWELSVDPAKVDPFGLVESKKTGVVVDATIQVIASRDLAAGQKPNAKLNSAALTATLLGEQKAKYSLKDRLKIESALDNQTLDLQSLRLYNDPKQPFTLAEEFFPAYNQRFSLPSYLQNFGKLGIEANLRLSANSGPLTANVSMELEKAGNSVRWKGAGTFVELMASATGSVGIGAGLQFLSIGPTALVDVEAEGSLNAAIGATVRFEASGNLLTPNVTLNTQKSGATLGLRWQVRAFGDAFFGLFRVFDKTFKSNGVETYQLLGSRPLDVASMLKDGTGVSSGSSSDELPGAPTASTQSLQVAAAPSIETNVAGMLPAESPAGLSQQGSLQYLSIITPTVTGVSLQLQSFADRSTVTTGLHRLDAVLVGQSNEVLLGSFDPGAQPRQASTHPLGFAAPVQNVSFTIDSATLDINEIYFLQFRYLKDGDVAEEMVEYEVQNVEITVPRTDYALRTPQGSLDDATLTFGSETGLAPVGSLLVDNTSGVDLTLRSAQILGGGFEWVNPLSGPIVVPAGQAVGLDVRLIDARLAANAIARIETDAPGKETVEVALVYDPASPVDATAPQILATGLRSSSWDTGAPSVALSDPQIAYDNLDRIEVVFSEDVDIEATHIVLLDPSGVTLPISSFQFDPNTNAATWTLATPLAAGHYLMEWNGAVADAVGNPLTQASPTMISIVPGDANKDGMTNFQDFVVVSNHFGQSTTAGPAKGDFNFDGVTNFADFVILSNDFGTDQDLLPQPNQTPLLDPIDDPITFEGTVLNLTAVARDADTLDDLTFSLVDGPSGATIDSDSGALQFTSQTGFGVVKYPVTVRVTDNGIPARSAERAFNIVAVPINQPPVIAAIDPLSVKQGSQLLYRVEATDGNGPVDTLVFSLDAAPAGATIDSNTGMISWAPDFNVPPGEKTFTVRVTDSFSPALSDTKNFTVNLTEFNLPPAIDPVANQSASEGELISFRATAADPNMGTLFTYSLGEGTPFGAAIDPHTGDFNWTPEESQGPGEFLVNVVVTDSGIPARSDSVQVAITVGEVNASPVLDAIGTRQVEAGQTLRLTATATDADLPENTLTYSVDTGAPAGLTIDPTDGILTWTPAYDEVGTYSVTVRVTDNGAVPLDDFETFVVQVTPETQPPQILPYLTESSVDPDVARIASISGAIVDVSSIVEFRAGFGGTLSQDFVDILSELDVEQEFQLNEPVLAAINGSPLGEGMHTLHFRAVDASGNVGTFVYEFRIDTTPPVMTLQIDPAFDSAPVGDLQTDFQVVNLIGQTEPFASVQLDWSLTPASADANGLVRWDNFRLELGRTNFETIVTDLAGNRSEFGLSVTRTTDANGCVGPDGFGYQACVTTPAFTDISSTGTPVLAGTSRDFVQLGTTELAGFQFEYFGVPTTRLFINSGGLITFDAGVEFYSGAWSGNELVNTPEGAAIAPLWNNWAIIGSTSSAVYWELIGSTGARELIVQWQDVSLSYGGGTATFQAVLRELDHSIQFNYLAVEAGTYPQALADSTVGIKAPGMGLEPTLRLGYGKIPNEMVGTGLSTRIVPVTPDVFPPLGHVWLANDTGDSDSDDLSMDPAVTGVLLDSNPIVSFSASLNSTDPGDFVDVLAELQPDGTFSFDAARMEQFNGGPLADGRHALYLIVADDQGNVASIDYSFDLDTLPPTPPALGLDPAFDTTPVGDLQTQALTVTLVGQTESWGQVYVRELQSYQYADETGQFEFPNIDLVIGDNVFTTETTDQAGNVGTTATTIVRLPRSSLGPDGFGYEARVVTPEFQDISGTGANILVGQDDAYAELNATQLGGFQFPLYGNTYDSLYVSTNGLITFDRPNSGAGGSLQNSLSMPAIAPLWNDLNVIGSANSSILWEVLGTVGNRQLVIQWHEVSFHGQTGTITFQVVLDEADGAVQFNYLDLDNDGPASGGVFATSGITIGSSLSLSGLVLATVDNDGPNEFAGTGLSTRFALATPDAASPLLRAELANDSGDFSADGLTNDPTIAGSLVDASAIAVLRAGFNNRPLAEFTDVLAALQPDKTFVLDTALLSQVYGAPLPDGNHTLHLYAEDAVGNATMIVDLEFQYDTEGPALTNLGLASGYDTGTRGDGRTYLPIVQLTGQTEPFLGLRVDELNRDGYSDNNGLIVINNVPLQIGQNNFTISVVDAAGNSNSASVSLTHIAAAGPDAFGYEAYSVPPEFNDLSRGAGGGSLRKLETESWVELDLSIEGFDFPFYGATYDSFLVSIYGVISFASESGHGISYPPPSTDALVGGNPRDDAIIAPLWDNYSWESDTPYNTFVGHRLEGEAGSKVLTIQWDRLRLVGGGDPISFQTILYEADGTIEFNYGNLDPNHPLHNEAHFATVGIKAPGEQTLDGSVLRLLHRNLGPNALVGSDKSIRILAPPGTISLMNSTSLEEASPILQPVLSTFATYAEANDLAGAIANDLQDHDELLLMRNDSPRRVSRPSDTSGMMIDTEDCETPRRNHALVLDWLFEQDEWDYDDDLEEWYLDLALFGR